MDDFSLTHTITSYECSEDHLMKPEFFLHLCQEMAEEHADLHDMGFGWAVRNHKIWVETQGNYELYRRPPGRKPSPCAPTPARPAPCRPAVSWK